MGFDNFRTVVSRMIFIIHEMCLLHLNNVLTLPCENETSQSIFLCTLGILSVASSMV